VISRQTSEAAVTFLYNLQPFLWLQISVSEKRTVLEGMFMSVRALKNRALIKIHFDLSHFLFLNIDSALQLRRHVDS